MLGSLLLVIIFIVALLLVGALIALPVLLPPIRKLGQRSQTVRVTTILLLGLVSFWVSFGLHTRVVVEVNYSIYAFYHNDHILTEPAPMGQAQRNKQAAVNELWVRWMMPPPLQHICYTGDTFGCDLADIMVTSSPSWGWDAYLFFIGTGLVSTSACSALVWRFTRRRLPKRVKVKPI